MWGRLSGSTCTQSSASRVNFSATSTGNESPSLRSIHLRSLHSLLCSSPPSITALAVSITEVLMKSPRSLSNRYLSGSSPDKSSKITTPKAYTSDFRVGTPDDRNSSDMYPLTPSNRMDPPVRVIFLDSSSVISESGGDFGSELSSPASPQRYAAPKWQILAFKEGSVTMMLVLLM